MKRLVLVWPITIILSSVAAGLAYFVFTDVSIRPLLVMWFLFVCPGMAVIRLLHLREAAVEWTLALALSFTLDAIIAGIQLYAQVWSPSATFAILIVLSLGGSFAQIATELLYGGFPTQEEGRTGSR